MPKVTSHTAATDMADADIFYIVADPGGTPASRKITRADVLTSSVADGASAVAHTLDNTNSLSTSGALLLDLKNAGTSKVKVDKDGVLDLRQGKKILISDTTDTTYIGRSASNQNIVFFSSGGQYLASGFAVGNGKTGIEVGNRSDTGDAYVTTPHTYDQDLYIDAGELGNRSLPGKDLFLVGGKASTVGNHDGGDIFADGGEANGSGTVGGIYFANTRGQVSFFGVTPAGQQSHVADPSGGTVIDAEARTAINSILVTLETFGFHATS